MTIESQPGYAIKIQSMNVIIRDYKCRNCETIIGICKPASEEPPNWMPNLVCNCICPEWELFGTEGPVLFVREDQVWRFLFSPYPVKREKK